jgi:propanediol dehydratase small subunit
MTRAFSGRPVQELTLDRVLAGELTGDDARISAAGLEQQARVAEEHGRPQLAGNLRRAAELTHFAEEEVLALYDALRPHRSTSEALSALAERLRERDAPLCARLVEDARAAYERRGLLA